jgi:hypothetical protein
MQVAAVEAGLLVELTDRGGPDVLAGADEAAGQGGLPDEGLVAPGDDERLQAPSRTVRMARSTARRS